MSVTGLASSSATAAWRGVVAGLEPDARGWLSRALSVPSVSGSEREYVELLADLGKHLGLETDLFETSESELERKFGPLSTHIPLKGRPTLVLRHRGRGIGPSLMFNAHSDVVGVPDETGWSVGPWAGAYVGETAVGRGACDCKGATISALWAMAALVRAYPRGLGGDVLMEVVPGEEDSVGIGTLTSVLRGYHSDASIVLEPTDNIPRCASRAGVRFTVTASGRAIHGTVKWLGVDAIAMMHAAQSALASMELEWNESDTDPLFELEPIARPMTLDRIEGGGWQGMMCDRCVASGYLELLPTDDVEARKRLFVIQLRACVARAGFEPMALGVEFSEQYRGHRLEPAGSPLCSAARAAMNPAIAVEARERWRAFNSGCEAGVRPWLHGTPTLVWGPGDLRHAHAADERVEFGDVRTSSEMFTHLAVLWCNRRESK